MSNFESFAKGCGLFIAYILVSFTMMFFIFAIFNGIAFSTWSSDAKVFCKAIALIIAVVVFVADVIDQQNS